MVSGDDDGNIYIMEPVSSDPDVWIYNLLPPFLDQAPGNIAGNPSVADLDGDGYSEIIAASYTGNQLIVYTYSPEI